MFAMKNIFSFAKNEPKDEYNKLIFGNNITN